MPNTQIRATVVIAVLNEAENIGPVCTELATALAPLAPYEVVFVDDGSTDATAQRLADLLPAHPAFRLVRHDRCCGKSAALRTGIEAARGAWIATMDGDGQNDPADVVGMLQAAWAHAGAHSGVVPPFVAGVRANRIDTASKRFGSRFANRFRQAVLRDGCPDTGCGMKAFRREDYLRLPLFEGMHRFFPALFAMYGVPMICHVVQDRARLHGQSKYTNLGRAIVGIGDLIGVVWLRNRTRLPARVTEMVVPERAA